MGGMFKSPMPRAEKRRRGATLLTAVEGRGAGSGEALIERIGRQDPPVQSEGGAAIPPGATPASPGQTDAGRAAPRRRRPQGTTILIGGAVRPDETAANPETRRKPSQSAQGQPISPNKDTSPATERLRRRKIDPCQKIDDNIVDISDQLNNVWQRIRKAEAAVKGLQQTLPKLEALRPGDTIPGLEDVPKEELPFFVTGRAPKNIPEFLRELVAPLAQLALTGAKNRALWETGRRLVTREVREKIEQAKGEVQAANRQYDQKERNLRQRARELDACRAKHG